MKIPNGVDAKQLERLLAYSDRYEISIQFWPTGIAVFINKHGIELTSFGGDANFAFSKGIDYLDRINKKR